MGNLDMIVDYHCLVINFKYINILTLCQLIVKW